MVAGLRTPACVRVALATAALLALQAVLPALSSATPTINEYTLNPGSLQPSGIVTGPDGNLWFGELGGPEGVGISSPSGAESRFTTGFTGVTQGVAVGEDEDLWFTEPTAKAIVRVTPLGVATVFAAANEPTAITSGPDGNLWFTETGGEGAIGRINAGTGEVTTFPTPTPKSKPVGIAAGPDGNLWFTESGGSGAVGRITTEGEITEFSEGLTANDEPTGIAQGPDESLWFTERGATAAIGRITTEGAITQYTSGLPVGAEPVSIAAADDGALYFTEQGGSGAIGTITTTGTVTQYTTGLTTSNKLEGITNGPEGNIWFTEAGGTAKIGVITVAPGVQSTEAGTVREHTAMLAATIAPNAQATSYTFEYGATTAYGHATAVASAGSGSTATNVSATIGGLSPDTVYHYRVVATSASGTTESPDATFTTPTAPTATTGTATALTSSSATLNGSVDPRGFLTRFAFEWGMTSEYGHRSPSSEASVGSGTSALARHVVLASLAPSTTYHFRIVASNCGGCAEGTTYGADQTFATLAVPAPEAGETTATPAATPSVTQGGSSSVPTTTTATTTGPSPPALATSALAGLVSGRVLTVPPGGATPQLLSSSRDIPVGSIVDASEGVVRITMARDRNGTTQSAEVWGGRFVLTQSANSLTTLRVLAHPVCSRRGPRDGVLAFASRAATKAPASGGLWARDNHGHFSTRGLNSVATVRGTYWGTFETCGGTLTVVRTGRVSVRDLERHRTVLLGAGHSYLARR